MLVSKKSRYGIHPYRCIRNPQYCNSGVSWSYSQCRLRINRYSKKTPEPAIEAATSNERARDRVETCSGVRRPGSSNSCIDTRTPASRKRSELPRSNTKKSDGLARNGPATGMRLDRSTSNETSLRRWLSELTRCQSQPCRRGIVYQQIQLPRRCARKFSPFPTAQSTTLVRSGSKNRDSLVWLKC
jgi:hypothetical protein